VAGLVASSALWAAAPATAVETDPSAAERIAEVEPEFISFGIDASQITERNSGNPFEFDRPRLMTLARALAPAIIRYSGTKIETTYYDDTGTMSPGDAPDGYEFVLARDEWLDALRFARGAGFGVMASTSAGPGPRRPDGTWDPANATSLLARAKAEGFPLAAVQLGNEPNITYYGSGLPPTYTAADYARDVRDFLDVKAALAPDAEFVGPGPFFTTGAERPLYGGRLGPDVSEIMAATGSRYDVVSYHQYPAFGDSAKCLTLTPRLPADTLAASFLDLPAGAHDYMAELRDAYAPGRSLWIDESSNTACGGIDEYSDRFVSTFYYLNSLGYLAREGVGVVTRWTLSGPQPYALIDDATLTPRPDYWAALLWRRTMGRQVLAPKVGSPDEHLRVYSHCTPSGADVPPGAVTTLLLNTNRSEPASVDLGASAERPARAYVVTGDPAGTAVSLNGTELVLGDGGELPPLASRELAGPATIPPASYAFVVSPAADNRDCGGTVPPPPKRFLKVRLKAPAQSLRKVAGTGRVRVGCRLNLRGRCRVTIGLGRAAATKIVKLPAGKARTIRVRLGKRIRNRLRRARRPAAIRLRVAARGTSPEAISPKTVRKRLRLRR